MPAPPGGSASRSKSGASKSSPDRPDNSSYGRSTSGPSGGLNGASGASKSGASKSGSYASSGATQSGNRTGNSTGYSGRSAGTSSSASRSAPSGSAHSAERERDTSARASAAGGEYSGNRAASEATRGVSPGANMAGSVGSYTSATRSQPDTSRFGNAASINTPAGGYARAEAPSPTRPDNRDFRGPVGLGGPGGSYPGGAPVDQARAYADAAQSMTSVGVRSIGGLANQTPSFRQAENQSMTDLETMRAPSFRQAEVQSLKDYAIESTLGMVRKAEARKTDPYNGLVWGGPKTHTNLTDMTVQEVMDFQRGMKKAGYASTAIGAYQTIKGTLAESVARLGIDPATTKFDATTQDKIGRDLIGQRAKQATKDGVINETAFSNALSREWAGLKSQTGKGTYDDDGINQATMSASTVADHVAGMVGGTAVNAGFAVSPAVRGTPPASTRFASTYLGRDAAPSAAVGSTDIAPNTRTGRTVDPVNPRSVAPVGSTPVNPTPQDSTVIAGTTPRSTTANVIAGGIDVLAGLVPGVGMAATGFNVISGLAGGRTIGQMAVDGFNNGTNLGPRDVPHIGDGRDRPAFDENTPVASTSPTAVTPVAAAPAKDKNRFVRNYLRPEQKWGRGLSSVAA